MCTNLLAMSQWVVLHKNGDSLKKEKTLIVEKMLLECTFQHNERPEMSEGRE